MTEQIPLREHIDALMEQRDLRYQQRFEAQERAISEARAAAEKRLDGMNEFRGTIQDVIGRYITRQEAIAMILAACAVTWAILGFLRK
jgi:CHASE3 domain sensor protein